MVLGSPQVWTQVASPGQVAVPPAAAQLAAAHEQIAPPRQ